MGCERTESERGYGHGCGKSDCLCEVLRYIKRIQKTSPAADCVECENDCLLAPLGSLSPARTPINTRVFSLFTKKGEYFKAFYKLPTNTQSARRGGSGGGNTPSNPFSCFSIFFRVQKVTDSCCATIQVLKPVLPAGKSLFSPCGNLNCDALDQIIEFEATGVCLTIDLDCFCGIQCILDTNIDLCPPS